MTKRERRPSKPYVSPYLPPPPPEPEPVRQGELIFGGRRWGWETVNGKLQVGTVLDINQAKAIQASMHEQGMDTTMIDKFVEQLEAIQ